MVPSLRPVSYWWNTMVTESSSWSVRGGDSLLCLTRGILMMMVVVVVVVVVVHTRLGWD